MVVRRRDDVLKIGEFSKLSMVTVKALRFYEKEGLLTPASVDTWTGYRYYETAQLERAATIKALRQLDFSIEEMRAYLSGVGRRTLLEEKVDALYRRQADLARQIAILHYLMEDENMNYQAVIKELPECVVYSEERRLERYSQATELILGSAEECRRLNPGIECTKPDYGFCEYLDGEHRDRDMLVRYSQAVTREGVGNERIQFRHLPATRAICIYHKGSYDLLGEAYAFLAKYAEENGYTPADFARECYIDGVWNKDDPAQWLTEIQLPIRT